MTDWILLVITRTAIPVTARRTTALIGALAALSLAALAHRGESNPPDWPDSAAAVFMTSEERRTWKQLTTDEDRERFRSEYWRRRDPNRETAINEFRELVEHRIADADRRFALGSTPGSHTHRGLAFVLLGAPSGEQIVAGPLNTTPRMEGGRLVMPRAAFDNREWHTWMYDRETSPELMQIVGRRDMEITFIVEPGRRDELQDVGFFSQVRERVASASRADGAGAP